MRPEKYLTPLFSQAALLPEAEQADFLLKLSGHPFFRPVFNDRDYRDLVLFCSNFSKIDSGEFAARMDIPFRLAEQWIKGEVLPYPDARQYYIAEMIELALNGHELHIEPVTYDKTSNVIKFAPKP